MANEEPLEPIILQDNLRRRDGRGRPPTFTTEDRAHLAELIRQHGIRGARRVAGVPVCIGTLVEIGREFNIKLRRGRRRAA